MSSLQISVLSSDYDVSSSQGIIEISKNGINRSEGNVHRAQDANFSLKTDVHDQKMKLVAQWLTPVALRIISLAQRINS